MRAETRERVGGESEMSKTEREKRDRRERERKGRDSEWRYRG